MSSSLEIIPTSVRLSLTTENLNISGDDQRLHETFRKKNKSILYHIMEEMNYLVIGCISDGSSYCPHQKKLHNNKIDLGNNLFLRVRDDD